MTKPKNIYMDYSATTPINPLILAKMMSSFKNDYSNPSSIYSSGRRARQIINKAREKVARIIGSQSSEVVFTGSGTESDNMAILGTARANRSHGNHIIISSIEHKAVLESAYQLERDGFVISLLPVRADGLIDGDVLIKLISDKTILISI